MRSYWTLNETRSMHEPNPAEWSIIIPAAGKGSRIAYELPKILFPVNGKPILEHLLEKVEHTIFNIIFVVSPAGRSAILDCVNKLATKQNRNHLRIKFQIQEHPLGMADAVKSGLAPIDTKQVAVLWGDQIGISQTTIEACQRLHLHGTIANLTLPTVFKKDSYIEIQRNSHGIPIKFLQRREGEKVSKFAESDCGYFVFKTEVIKTLLSDERVLASSLGATTKEQNLLQILPYCYDENLHDSVRTFRVDETCEAIGINTREDASQFEKGYFKQNS